MHQRVGVAYAFSHLLIFRVDPNSLHPRVGFDSYSDLAHPLHPRVGIDSDWLAPDSGSGREGRATLIVLASVILIFTSASGGG